MPQGDGQQIRVKYIVKGLSGSQYVQTNWTQAESSKKIKGAIFTSSIRQVGNYKLTSTVGPGTSMTSQMDLSLVYLNNMIYPQLSSKNVDFFYFNITYPEIS